MVSIIIPTLNEEKYLPDLLACLKKQSFKDFEIIVADAGSTDNTVDVATKFGAKVIKGGIPCIGRNNGANVATGGILIFIDSDVKFDESFIENAVKEFNNKNLDFAVPFFKTESDKLKYAMFFYNANFYKRLMQYTRFPDGTGQFFIAKRKSFEALGGYKDFHVAEDTDLAWRAARKKYKVGTVSPRFYSSTRRLEKIGVAWTLFFWSILGVFMAFGIIHRKGVQEFALKLYGGWGKHKNQD